ncbi:MAG: hypothetical protein OXR64_12635 [Chloroflexota bacterium]|nr:hypothetical protein [Chloroflexota bacterium]MDE2920673.1 hypothetical protein [Chloroflexota bacterium]
MGSGFINRLLRALRLDPTLYREVAAPGASTEQAALVVILAAVGFSFAQSARSLVSWLSSSGSFWWSGLTTTEANAWIAMDLENYRVVVRVLALVAAWPVWAAGLWLVSKRMSASRGQAPGFGQVARVLAFAQAPGVFGPALLLPTTVGAALVLSQTGWLQAYMAPPANLAFLDFLVGVGWPLLLVWVFLGSLVALREGLGLSGGQALGALIIVGAGLAVLLGLVVTVGSVVAAAVGAVPEAFGLEPRVPVGLDHGDAIAAQVAPFIPYLTAFQFDFNLGLHFGPSLMSSLGQALATIR